MLAAGFAAAEEGMDLQLDALLPPLDLDQPVVPEDFLVPSQEELKLALWSSDLGRVRFHLAAEASMLGRGGLVHGGSTIGIGMGLSALGGAGDRPAYWPTPEQRWRDLSFGDKAKTVASGALVAAIIWQVLSEAD
jgi:hypothetical protein